MDDARFGPYRLEALLGRGGMGEVFRAYDTDFERVVALKRLAPHLADDPEFRARFLQEARLSARLRNPHIITIHHWGEIDGHLYIDMRYVDGFDAAELIRAVGPLPPARAVGLIEQVASALDTAHAAGLVHRDVKPGNLLIDREAGTSLGDFVYLADFGITRTIGATSHSLTRTGTLLGSLNYMAPEQFDGRPDRRIDIYALACVLFELLTGQKPYQGSSLPALMHAHMHVAPPAPSDFVHDITPALDEVIRHGMAKKRDDRYATAGELATAARAALPGRPRSDTHDGVSTAEARRRRDAEYAYVAAHRQPEQAVDRPGRHVLDADPATDPPPAEGADPLATERFGPHAADPESGPESEVTVVAPPRDPHREPPGGTDRQGADGTGRERADDTGLPALGSPPRSPRAGEAARATPSAVRGPAVDEPIDRHPPDPPAPTAQPSSGTAGGPRRRSPVLPVVAAVVAVLVLVVGVFVVLPGDDTGPPQDTPGSTALASGAAGPTTQAPPAPASTPTPSVQNVVPVDSESQGLAVTPDGARVLVAGLDSRTLSIVHLRSGSPAVTVPLPSTPRFVAVSPDGRKVYVGMSTGEGADSAIAVVDPDAASVVALLPSGGQPYVLAIAPNGALWVPNHVSADVRIYEGDPPSPGPTVKVADRPHGVAFSVTANRAYTANHESGSISVIDLASTQVVETIQIGRGPYGIAASPDGKVIATGNYDDDSVTLVDTATNQVTATVPAGRTPLHLTFSRDGAHLYVVNYEAGTLSTIDVVTREVVATVKVGNSPRYVAATPDGTRLLVSNGGDGTVSVLNAS